MPELWLKNTCVMSFTEQNGAAVSITQIKDRQLLPVPLMLDPSIETLNKWLSRRTIPPQREGLKDVIERFGNKIKPPSNRLSLTDQYWIKYRLEEWNKINYFSHYYSKDIGDMFFKPWTIKKGAKINYNSPDTTTNGMLKKRWIQKNGSTDSYLVKAGSSVTNQEPLSEILVSVFLEQLKIIPFVRYDYHVEGLTLCSICKNFITINTELVPLTDFYHFEERQKDSNESINDHILRMCEKVFGGVPGMEEYLDAMNFIDLVTGQEDRNLSNIALIRDTNTMEIIGPAPLFDFGAAYWSDGKIAQNIKTKRFTRIQQNLLHKMDGKINLDKALSDTKFHSCIDTYPLISEEKKEELKKNIDARNKELLRQPEKEPELT